MAKPSKPHLVRAAECATLPSYAFPHPLNPNSEAHMQSLGDATGLERLGVQLMRLPPGKDSFAFHAHYFEEEFLYILAGRGIAEIGDEEHEVGPGDFMGFPTPSVGHNLKNPFDVDLIYLAGGERRAGDIIDFPRHGRRVVRAGMAWSLHSTADVALFGPFPPLTRENAAAPWPPGSSDDSSDDSPDDSSGG